MLHSAVGGAIMGPHQGKGMFVPLFPDCIVSASVIEIWVGLGPETISFQTTIHWYDRL